MSKYIICHRRGTIEQWTTSDITPLAGEIVIELDEVAGVHKLKIGDGVHKYGELAYLTAGANDITQKLFIDATKTVVSPSADYAEVGEWEDGNPYNEDRHGYFVSIADVDDNTIKIRKATSIDDVRGVTATHPGFSGNASLDKFDIHGELLPQYSYVGLMGIVSVIDNGTCEVGERCMPSDDGTAVPSSNSMGYGVLSRVDENHVLIAVEPGADMIQRVKTAIRELNTKTTELQTNIEASGHKLSLTIDNDTYVMTAALLDKNDNAVSTQEVSLPLESIVVDCQYDSNAKEIVLTLQNGNTVKFNTADFINGLVNTEEFNTLVSRVNTLQDNIDKEVQDRAEAITALQKVTDTLSATTTKLQETIANKIPTFSVNEYGELIVADKTNKEPKVTINEHGELVAIYE